MKFPDVPIEELSNRQIGMLYKELKQKNLDAGHTLPQSHSRWCGACESFMHVKRLIESRLRTKQMQRFKW